MTSKTLHRAADVGKFIQNGDLTTPRSDLKPKTLTLKKRNAVDNKSSFFPTYKFTLLMNDLAVTTGAFALGAWLTGWLDYLNDDPGSTIAFAILSLTAISFFQTYRLYNYNFLFSLKEHLKNLVKSFCWSILTLIIVLFLFNSSELLDNNFYFFISILLTGAVVLLFLSRFLWSHLLDFILALGMAFLIVGLTGMFSKEGIPVFMTNYRIIFFCFLIAAMLLAVSRIFLVHIVFNKWLRRRFRRQVVIIGSDSEADNIARYIVDNDAPFWIAGTMGQDSTCGLKQSLGKAHLGEIEEIQAIVDKFKIDDIIITDEDIDKPTLVNMLDVFTSAGINAWFPPKLLPIINVKLYPDNFCGLPMIRLCSQKNNWLFNKIKLIVDVLLALIVFILQLPLFLLIVVAIKLESPGPVFYLAKAVGKNGNPFSMYKFRSMRMNSSNEIHKDYVSKLIKGEIGNEEGEKKPLKITNDPRITRVGNLIRKFSLDELPQLINVLKGDMSLVGPRPCLPYEYELYKDWYKKRASVPSGITGLWQVAGRSEVSFEDMILLDLYYVYNRSLTLDFNILFETIFVVLGMKGAY
ncbi:MAG: sugar transferase [Proteobacteria bacterium]|nr:sugar transferase [Pseudomonadota bacterium]MBU1709422.1 sugar transferase [Pseudomonadota bacterium]